jgi:DNA-binding CsgD family transcriptional regulator
MADPSPSAAVRDSHGNPTRVEALVRRLVSDIVGEDPRAAGPVPGKADLVILDVEVDGVRCLLLRIPDVPAPLSPRELEIARMVAKGYPNKTIASVLDISSWTVASHLRRVFSKLGVSSRAAMVARLLEDGPMDPGEGANTGPPVVGSPRPGRPQPTGLAT